MIDRDFDPTLNNPDEVDESFAIDVQTQQLGSGVNTYNGTFGFAFAGLSFERECLPGFTEENCVDLKTVSVSVGVVSGAVTSGVVILLIIVILACILAVCFKKRYEGKHS